MSYAGLAVLMCAATFAQDADFFEKNVRPVLAERCQGCHNPKAKRAGLDLTTGEGFYAGADSGALFDAAKPEESRILKAIGYHERIKMPPTGKLADAQIAGIREWVIAGAKWPGVDASKVTEAANAARDRKITEGQKRFWSFQPRKAVEPPAVKNAAWIANPIDAFILAKLEAKNLAPAPPAAKLTLLRRVTFDLTGLPPTEAEIAAFLADESPQAYEKVIDRLLASPRYGERWGRHWLDVARYADSTGADEDHRYPDAWRYRDYVIDSFNRDLPYNRFVQEQIAGDLVTPEGDDVKIGVNRRGLVATGFLAIGPRLIAEQDKKKMFYDFVDEQIATTTRAFLGLTVDCARCHDHKFDPISQKDYTALASIFASTKTWAKLEGTVSQMYRPPLVPRAEYDAWDKHQQKIAAKKRDIEMIDREQARLRLATLAAKLPDYMVAVRTGAGTGLDADVLARWKEYLKPGGDVRPYLAKWEKADGDPRAAAEAYRVEFEKSAAEYDQALAKWRKAVEKANADGLPGPEKPSFDATYHRFFEDVYLDKTGPFAPPKDFEKTFPAEAASKRQALVREKEELTKTSPPQPDLAIGVAEGDPVTQHLFVRGDVHSEGETVPKRFPIILAGEDQPGIGSGSGRRELAAWLTDPNHPLVARVMTNRVWQGHFGEGIVRTPSNFGLLGEKPTHPELLDWMAQRFVDDGWSVKRLHKLILLSNTYRQSTQITKEKFEADPANRLWSRFQRRRLDVEEIRDAMLAIDGTIDLAMGGSMQEGTGTDGENSSQRKSVDPATSKRRTVYIPLRRSNLPSLLNLFDFGDATTTGEGRARTNVAPQALFAMNSPFLNRSASALAENTAALPVDDTIKAGFLKVLSRPAAEPEIGNLRGYMAAFPDEAEFARRRSLYRVLLGSNEFFYVD